MRCALTNCMHPFACVAASSAIQIEKQSVLPSRHSPLSWCHGVAAPPFGCLTKELLNFTSTSPLSPPPRCGAISAATSHQAPAMHSCHMSGKKVVPGALCLR